MEWSYSLGRIAGVQVRIHLAFLLLLGWFAIAAGLKEGQAAAVETVAFVLAVFACVLAHEFGHALVARRFGIATRDITLLPIGGVASLTRIPENPMQELLIAIAGPLVNVVIAILLFAFFGANLDPALIAAGDETKVGFVTRLALVNVMLVLFNLLPAFPMDGGRVLRALLTMFLDRARATRLAASIGQIVAFGLGFLGLFGNPLLIFIALFVFLAASRESYDVEMSEAVAGAEVTEASITSFVPLSVQASVAEAVRALLDTTQKEFPVVDGAGRLRGVLTRDGIIRALSETGPETPVLDAMLRDVPVVFRHAPLSDAVAKLQEGGHPLVGVVDAEERVIGMVTLENLAEFMLTRQGAAAAARRRG